jgi:excinuclease ABC subunit A
MLDEALKLLLDEVRTRLKYLCDVGLHYLTLDRQSRTLSGGEVQRINLTTALGTSLVNTLFVLDEPSIGLHPRDMNRIVQAMHRLRDAGNTLVVVEHDPAVMLAADRLIDMGPGPGERGGQIVFDGTPQDRAQRRHADRRLPGRAQDRGAWAFASWCRTTRPSWSWKARATTTCRTSAWSCRCSAWWCVTGVSGSGKSTLMQDVLYPALARHFGKATERRAPLTACWAPSSCRRRVRRPEPHRQDRAQQPGQLRGRVRRTAQDLCRRAAGARAQLHRRHLQLQRRRRPLPHLRRQWLRARGDAVPVSDVYLRCPDCDGRRYRPRSWT